MMQTQPHTNLAIEKKETKTIGPEESTDGRGRIIYSTHQTALFYQHAMQLKKQMLPLQI